MSPQLPLQPCGQHHSTGRPCGVCKRQTDRERQVLQQLLLELDNSRRDPADSLWGAARVLLLLRESAGDPFDRVNAALKELWHVAEEAGLMVLCNDDEADDGSPQIVLTLEGQWPDGK